MGLSRGSDTSGPRPPTSPPPSRPSPAAATTASRTWRRKVVTADVATLKEKFEAELLAEAGPDPSKKRLKKIDNFAFVRAHEVLYTDRNH